MKIALYYRERCHLCDELAALLFRNWPAHAEQMEWIDIDADPDLVSRYGTCVPVLIVGGREICAGLPDTESLYNCFGAPADQVQ